MVKELQLHQSGVEYASLWSLPLLALEKDLRTGMMLKSGGNTASTDGVPVRCK